MKKATGVCAIICAGLVLWSWVVMAQPRGMSALKVPVMGTAEDEISLLLSSLELAIRQGDLERTQ